MTRHDIFIRSGSPAGAAERNCRSMTVRPDEGCPVVGSDFDLKWARRLKAGMLQARARYHRRPFDSVIGKGQKSG